MPEATVPKQHSDPPYCPIPDEPDPIIQSDTQTCIPTRKEADFRAYNFDDAVKLVDGHLADAVYAVWQIDALTELLVKRLATQHPSTQAMIIAHIAQRLVEDHFSDKQLYAQIIERIGEF